MTAVLVHGNPATSRVWDYIADHLRTDLDLVRLSPPGFGAPVPVGFQTTVLGYKDWLIGELEQIDHPVDLVGQDWGGAHVLNVAMTRPDLLGSWCSDAIGLFDPDYQWHGHAQIWQSTEAGEAWVAEALDQEARGLAGRMIAQRCDPVITRRMVAGFDPQLGSCILSLYRSAAQPAMSRLGQNLEQAAARPGLVVIPTDDAVVGTVDERIRSAVRTGARTAVLHGFEHWWITEDRGRRAAQVLRSFWGSLDR